MDETNALLKIPRNISLDILRGNGINVCALLPTEKFIAYCRDRDLRIDKEQLLRLEKVGLFSPVFRVKKPDKKNVQSLTLPLDNNDIWFKEGWAWDTTGLHANYKLTGVERADNEAYFSIFQIFHLDVVLSSMTISFQLDSILDSDKEIDWNEIGNKWIKCAESHAESLKNHEFRRSASLLCQYISDRYYPKTQGDQRTINVTQGSISIDQWIQHHSLGWNWYEYSLGWNPHKVEEIFQLTPMKLKHAYEAFSQSQAYIDPLEKWYQLVQFVDVRERKKLKGAALHAETLRSGAMMLWFLYKDLYNEEMPLPNELVGQIIKHIPEREVRADTRRHLEFISNRFHLNPQPKLVLFVEGKSEEIVLNHIFEQYIGANPGKYAIEIVCLWGVENATGSKEDRFRAILRLIDYLHHHQTITFLILDNEGYAKRLKLATQKAKSTHHNKRFITRSEYIKIWKISFEFDNYSCTEIAFAMNHIADGRAFFSAHEVMQCKNSKMPGVALSALYKKKTEYELNKIKLNQELIRVALLAGSKKKLGNREIIKTLKRIEKLAVYNPFPTLQESWEKNQASAYLGKIGHKKRRGKLKKNEKSK